MGVRRHLHQSGLSSSEDEINVGEIGGRNSPVTMVASSPEPLKTEVRRQWCQSGQS